jgi:hypothetical protein
MPTIRHRHSSSRYDRPASSLAAQVKQFTSSSANLCTFTEVNNDRRAATLKAAGWQTVRGRESQPGQAQECAIMVRTQHFRVVAWGSKKVTEVTWSFGKAPMQQWAVWCVLDPGKVFVSVLHCPSGVEGGKAWSPDPADADNVKAWKAGVKGWGDWTWKTVRPKYKTQKHMLVADWNLNLREAWCREQIDSRLPEPLRCQWRTPYPKDGTHGSRLIDGTWADFGGGDSFLVKDDASSDHRPYGDTLAF